MSDVPPEGAPGGGADRQLVMGLTVGVLCLLAAAAAVFILLVCRQKRRQPQRRTRAPDEYMEKRSDDKQGQAPEFCQQLSPNRSSTPETRPDSPPNDLLPFRQSRLPVTEDVHFSDEGRFSNVAQTETALRGGPVKLPRVAPRTSRHSSSTPSHAEIRAISPPVNIRSQLWDNSAGGPPLHRNPSWKDPPPAQSSVLTVARPSVHRQDSDEVAGVTMSFGEEDYEKPVTRQPSPLGYHSASSGSTSSSEGGPHYRAHDFPSFISEEYDRVIGSGYPALLPRQPSNSSAVMAGQNKLQEYQLPDSGFYDEFVHKADVHR